MNESKPHHALTKLIWNEIERALFSHLASFAEEMGCKFVGRRTAKSRSIVMTDLREQSYEVDAIVVDDTLRPLALIEAPGFIDKAIQVCEAHQAIKQKYGSIKKSLMVTVDNGSEESVKRLQSCDIDLVQIPLQQIQVLLAPYGIEFNEMAHESTGQSISISRFASLSEEEKQQIGQNLISPIKSAIDHLLAECFVDLDVPSVSRVRIELESDHGEITTREFTHLPEAIYFLQYADANTRELWV